MLNLFQHPILSKHSCLTGCRNKFGMTVEYYILLSESYRAGLTYNRYLDLTRIGHFRLYTV